MCKHTVHVCKQCGARFPTSRKFESHKCPSVPDDLSLEELKARALASQSFAPAKQVRG